MLNIYKVFNFSDFSVFILMYFVYIYLSSQDPSISNPTSLFSQVYALLCLTTSIQFALFKYSSIDLHEAWLTSQRSHPKRKLSFNLAAITY